MQRCSSRFTRFISRLKFHGSWEWISLAVAVLSVPAPGLYSRSENFVKPTYRAIASAQRLPPLTMALSRLGGHPVSVQLPASTRFSIRTRVGWVDVIWFQA